MMENMRVGSNNFKMVKRKRKKERKVTLIQNQINIFKHTKQVVLEDEESRL